MSVKLLSNFLQFHFLISLLSLVGSQTIDAHGGIPMGKVAHCDDAESDISVDWNPTSTVEYTCVGPEIHPTQNIVRITHEDQAMPPLHVCLPTEIHYNVTPPTSGAHRPNWPAYGEYRYIPPQRWLHSLEHGAIVLLYHPCADGKQVNKLKSIVRSCLRRHVITPYQLPAETPLALLSWKWKLMMSSVASDTSYIFVKDHAKKGRETTAYDGHYSAGLMGVAKVVLGSDFFDGNLCPNYQEDQYSTK